MLTMRLIDADELRAGWLEWNPYEIIEANTVLESIDEQATLTPPVRTGRWIQKGDMPIVCSECASYAYTEGDYRQVETNYCPDCGAYMRPTGSEEGKEK